MYYSNLLRPLGRPRRRWEDNIRVYLKEIGIKKRNWGDSTQDRDYWEYYRIIFCPWKDLKFYIKKQQNK